MSDSELISFLISRGVSLLNPEQSFFASFRTVFFTNAAFFFSIEGFMPIQASPSLCPPLPPNR